MNEPASHESEPPPDSSSKHSAPIISRMGSTEIHKNILATINALKGINCELHIIGKLSNIQIEQLKISGIQYKNKYNIDNAELLNFYINH